MNPYSIAANFALEGTIKSIQPFGDGYINDTFKIDNLSPAAPNYLLQRINHHVFRDVPGMMRNIALVTDHIRHKTKDAPFDSTLTIVPTVNGQLFYEDAAGNFWRVFIFISGLQSFNVPQTIEQVYQSGKAFGHFLSQLADFPAEQLVDTIPKFHDVLFRLENLKAVLQKHPISSTNAAYPFVQFVFSEKDRLSKIQVLKAQGLLPLRVTHNDTKFNNLLLDATGVGRCVIDLDTVMPGLVHYDFGDGIRTTSCLAEEDEPDLEKVVVDIERYKAFTQGYLESSQQILTSLELEYLPLSGPLFAYIMGIRFLTDHLDGDHYYKVQFRGHNLQRASCQLTLCKRLLDRLAELKTIH